MLEEGICGVEIEVGPLDVEVKMGGNSIIPIAVMTVYGLNGVSVGEVDASLGGKVA